MRIFDFNRKKLIKSNDLLHLMDIDIFDVLQMYLPEGWVQVNFFAGCTSTSVAPKFYVLTSDYKWIDSNNLLPTETLVNNVLNPISEIILNVRKQIEAGKHTEKKIWSTYELTISSDGNFGTRYEYTFNPKSSSQVERFIAKKEKEWVEKYARKKEQ